MHETDLIRKGLYSSALYAALSLSVLIPVSASAQQNPLGGVIGGLMNAALMQAAQEEWQKVPEPRASCLVGQLRNNGLNVSVLIQRGVGPNHPSLAQINFPCQRMQEEREAEIARQRQEEAERQAQQRREEAQRQAEAKRIETERVTALRKIVLRKNYRCDIDDSGFIVSSFCNENLYRRNDSVRKAPIKIAEAIEGKLKSEDLVVYVVEKDDAMARRQDMRVEFKNAASVPDSRFNCEAPKSSRETLVCKSYELVILDNLYADYYARIGAFDKKGLLAKKDKDISQKFAACKTDGICLQRAYVDGVNGWAAVLKDNQINVPTYEDNLAARRAAEAATEQLKIERIQAERQKEEAAAQERKRQLEAKAEEDRRLAQARADEERRRAEAVRAAREAEIKRNEEARLAREKEEQEKRRLADEKAREEAALREALRKKWSDADDKLSAEANVGAVQTCKSGAYGQKIMASVIDLGQRASARQKLAQECSCFVTHTLVSAGGEKETDDAIAKFYSLGESQQATRDALARYQNECRANVSPETLDRWKSN